MDVSAFARGFLDLIGANNRGNGLRLAADFIQPTLDVTELLLTQRREIVGIVDQAIATGTNDYGTTFVVPSGEMWRIRFLSQTLTAAPAADMVVTRNSLRIKPPLLPGTIGVAVVAHDWGDYTFRVGTTYVSFAWEPSQPLYLAAGTVLDFSFFLTVDPVAGAWSSRLLIDRLRV